MHPDAQRLFALDAAFHSEADAMLAASRIGAILDDGGYQSVGSYTMRTMTWRDLDFERYQEMPDWGDHWAVGTKLAQTRWCVRLQCMDVYREAWPEAQPNFGLYWGLRVADPGRAASASPGDPTVWKLDLWTARPAEFAGSVARRETWASLMTDEARSYILALKEAVCVEPEYRKSLVSVHIYEAVLEHGIRELEEFKDWWSIQCVDER